MKLFTLSAVEKLQEKYIDAGGDVHITEGVLLDDAIMYGKGLKTTIAKAVYINEWSSAYNVRTYNNMPRKYESIINS